MPWYHHLNPYVIGPFGPHQLGIRWYGLAYLLGFYLGYVALRRAATSGRVKGLTIETVENLIFWLVLGVLGGGRIGYCVQYMDRWIHDPLFIFKINEGGMAFFGGISGVVLALLYFNRKHGLDLFELGDVLAPVAAFSLGIGRIANFINGELYGIPTGSSWGVIFPSRPGEPRHPSQIYDSASHLLLCLILVLLARTAWGRKRGMASCTFLVLYGLFRVITEIWRDQDYHVEFFGPRGVFHVAFPPEVVSSLNLSGGQVASIILSLVGVGLYILVSRQAQKRVAAESAT